MSGEKGFLLSIDSFSLQPVPFPDIRSNDSSWNERDMKIGRLLFLSGMPRQAFDNFERRGHLGFLKRTRRDGVDRFEYAHAIGLAAFWRFRQLGLDPVRIAEILDYSDHWRAICGAARREQDALQHIGVAFDQKGRLVLEGDRRSDCDRSKDLAAVYIDLAELDKDLRAQITPDEALTDLVG